MQKTFAIQDISFMRGSWNKNEKRMQEGILTISRKFGLVGGGGMAHFLLLEGQSMVSALMRESPNKT